MVGLIQGVLDVGVYLQHVLIIVFINCLWERSVMEFSVIVINGDLFGRPLQVMWLWGWCMGSI